MDNSPAEDIRTILEGDGVEVNGWQAYTAFMPDSPDRAIAVYDTGGLAPNPRWGLDQPQVQVMVRGNKQEYQQTYQKTKDVRNLLLGRDAIVVGLTNYFLFVQQGDIIFLGYDEEYRPTFSTNWRLARHPEELGNRTAF